MGVLAVTALGCGGDDAAPPTDAGSDTAVPIDGSPPCMENTECEDTSFCNGVEFCDDGQCKRGAPVNCDDGVACTTDLCSDTTSSCRNTAPDFDRDGHADMTCLNRDGEAIGDDCDDDDAQRFPGNIEVCDVDGVDEDCNPNTIGNKDQDNDGAIDAKCCNPAGNDGATLCGTDCDDLKPSVNPTASEVCDLFDNDCDGETDEEGAVMLFPDTDYDGHGEEGSTAVAQCAGTLGFSTDDIDCDDDDPAVHAAQVEICDGKNNDCDEVVDESPRAVFWYRDRDGDGFGGRLDEALFACAPPDGYDLRSSDCNDENAAINPAAVELCDGMDNNCDNVKSARITGGPNDFEDDDNDGSADFACGALGTDCDDNDKSIGGTLIEICDKLDNDCDDLVDEDVADTVWYQDSDGDGYGDERLPAVVFCAPLSGRSAYPGDCNDADPTINPGAFERCSDVAMMSADENCNGQIDEAPCTTCGDGVREGSEQCDERRANSTGLCVDPDGVCNSNTLPNACRLDCRRAYCGDAVIDAAELCDDGAMNSTNADTCQPNCTAPTVVCGDGFASVRFGEICEPGAGVDGDICATDCTYEGWVDTGCTSVAPIDLGSTVGQVVTGETTMGGTNQVAIDPTLASGNCTFFAGEHVGPERAYTWSAPASLLYAMSVSNAGMASRLTIAVFFDGGQFPTSCSEPFVCFEPPTPATALLNPAIRNEPTVVVVDSVAGQTFDLSIVPLLCCPSDTSPSNPGPCAVTHNQAQLDCALAAVAATPACLDDWDASCVAAADAACGNYTCP